MKDLLVKQGLTEEQANGILNAMKEAKVYTTKLENIDERYNKLKEQKKELEEKIKIQDETIKSFEGGLTKEQAEALKKENESKIEAQAIQFKQSKATDKLFNEYKFSSENARIGALTQFEKAGLKFENDNWVGGKEFLDEMKKNDPKTFVEETTSGGSGFNPGGADPQPKGDSTKQFMDAIFNNQLRK
ncbi:MAG: hypothetical protein DBY38_02150 [Clostridium cadaveris]|uniref:Phage minor structural protein GP20 n=1 Tax=Clostridium cadaveris TaxID=1529 RepID=A0A316MFK0_9CLOT|nr:MAG: hypothetical protein DBY38_02150 [Clostridium cadaveris]